MFPIRGPLKGRFRLKSGTVTDPERSQILILGNHSDDSLRTRVYEKVAMFDMRSAACGGLGLLWSVPYSTGISPCGGQMEPEAHETESETTRIYRRLYLTSISSS